MLDVSQPRVALADTNVFVALFAGPSHSSHEASLGLFGRVAEGDLSLIVTPVIVAELVYACETVLRWSRPVISNRLASLLGADGLSLREPLAVLTALELYGRTSKLDFADAYLAGAALTDGPPTVASFDRDFDIIEGVQRVAA